MRHSLDRGGVSPTTCTNSLFLADLTFILPLLVQKQVFEFAQAGRGKQSAIFAYI